MRRDPNEPVRVEASDVDLTMQEINEILYLSKEAKNRRISAVLIHPDYKRASSLFVRGCDYVSAKPGRI